MLRAGGAAFVSIFSGLSPSYAGGGVSAGRLYGLPGLVVEPSGDIGGWNGEFELYESGDPGALK